MDQLNLQILVTHSLYFLLMCAKHRHKHTFFRFFKSWNYFFFSRTVNWKIKKYDLEALASSNCQFLQFSILVFVSESKFCFSDSMCKQPTACNESQQENKTVATFRLSCILSATISSYIYCMHYLLGGFRLGCLSDRKREREGEHRLLIIVSNDEQEIRLSALLKIKTDVLVPVCETNSSLQVAAFTSVALGADTQVSPLSRLYAGGITSTRPGWAQPSIYCGKGKKKKHAVFRSCVLSLFPICACFSLSPLFPLSFTLPTPASCHQEQNWEHNQPRYTGKRLIYFNRMRDLLCVLIRRSKWARSTKKIFFPSIFSCSFPFFAWGVASNFYAIMSILDTIEIKCLIWIGRLLKWKCDFYTALTFKLQQPSCNTYEVLLNL